MSGRSAAFPYWRLSSFYFLYFACLGVMVPYWSLYLESAGLSAAAIGIVLAVTSGTRIVAPNFWGWIADRSGRRLLIIRTGAVMAALCFALLPAGESVAWVAMCIALHTFFWSAILAQYEVITLAAMGSEVHRYGQVRLWGSISFVVLVVLVGMLFDHAGVARFPVVMMLPLLMLVAGSFAIRDAAPPAARRHGSGVGALLRSRVLWSFLGASFLLQLSHAPYYGFFSLLLSREGYSSTAIGYLWALGVIAEILFFAVAHHVLERFSLRSVLVVSMLLAALRWLMIGFGAGSVTMLVLAQCLHAATFGSFHAAGIEFVRRHFGYADQGQGQALYSAISFGAGGALGALGSGWLWDRSQHAVFLLAALGAAAGAVLLRAGMGGDLVGASPPLSERKPA
jgi:PPP family 3-phenylpropionic acid transporter